jgi:hypothetical protein
MCDHKNVIITSFQVSNISADVDLKLDDEGRIIDFEFKNPIERAGGEISCPAFYCLDCETEFEL